MPISIPSAAFGFCSVCSWRRCWFAYIARRSCTFGAWRRRVREREWKGVWNKHFSMRCLTIVCSLAAAVVVFFFVSQSFGRITIFFIFVVLFPMGQAVGVDIHKYSSHCFALLFLWLLFLRLSSLLTPSPALPSLLLPQVSAIYVDYFYGAVTWWPIENQNRIHLNTTGNMSICMQRNREREGAGEGEKEPG